MIATDTAVPDPSHCISTTTWSRASTCRMACMASGGSALNWFVERIAAGEAEAAHAPASRPTARLDALAAQTLGGGDGVQIVTLLHSREDPIHDPEGAASSYGLSLNHGLGHPVAGASGRVRLRVPTPCRGVQRHWASGRRAFVASDGGAFRRGLWMQNRGGHPWAAPRAAAYRPSGIVARRRMDGRDRHRLSDDWAGTRAFIRPGDRVDPDPGNRALYDAGYRRFRETYRRLSDIGGDRP